MFARVCLAAAVAVVVLGTVADGRGPSVSAQASGPGGVADCGAGNPLNGRTQGVVDVIVDALKTAGTLTASQTCSDVTDIADLATVTGTLLLNHSGLTQLRSRDFDGLSAVTRLQMVTNSLTSLPADTFLGMTSLTRLWLNNNRLTSVDVGAFNGLGALQRLYLNENELTTLPATVFSSTTSLQQLYLSSNRFESIPAGLLDGLTALNTFAVNDNYLETDDLGFLTTSMSSLGTLNLNDNLLTSDGSGPDDDLPTNIFGIHPSLHTVFLDNNRMVELPNGVFTGMKAVRRVSIQNNRLMKLQAGVFDGVTWWQSGFITLEGNLIRTIDEDVFNGAPCEPPATPGPSDPTNCLIELNLSYNQIESVPAGLFSGMTRLRRVRLNGNLLTTLPAGFYSGMTAMTWVDLGQNLIESLPDGLFEDQQSLYRVNLHDNKLTSVPLGWFNGLPTIASGPDQGKPDRPRVLSLYDNQIPQSVQMALPTQLPSTSLYFENPFPAQPRVIPPDDGIREEQAYCGPGHALTGRTIEIAYRIMEAAFPSPDSWPAAVATNPTPSLQSSWSFSLASWQSRHGTGPPPTPTTITPALCNLITADDLTNVATLDITSSRNNLNAKDFQGLTNLRRLVLTNWFGNTDIRTLPAGILDGLTNLRTFELRNGLLGSLPDGVFDDLTSLTSLNLSGNFLTSLPDGVFANNGNLRTIHLAQNRLNSLPTNAFRGLSELRVLSLHLNDLDADDFPVGTFNGLSQLRTLTLWGNNFRTLYLNLFANQGLSKLRVLRIGQQNEDRTTQDEFRFFLESLPSLTRLDRLTGARLLAPTATPVPTATATPTFHERLQLPIVTKVVPQVRSSTVKSGDEIRLSFALYNIQDALDNDLFTHDSMRIVWSDTGGGTFSESPGAGADRDGEINDREVIWRAPDLPGRHTVTAKIEPDWACSGSPNECEAVFTVMVVRGAFTATPEPTPCPTTGSVSSSVTDADGNAYTMITPADGGEFLGEGVSVTVPRGAPSGCWSFGLRAYALESADDATTRTRYGNWTASAQRYAVDVASSEGAKLSNMSLRLPADVCVPLPDEFRARLSSLSLLRESSGDMQPLTSKVRRHATLGYTLCGAVSEFPAVVVAASRGDFGETVAPSPTPDAEVPETGAPAPSGMYVLLAFLLGLLVLTGISRIVRIRG